MTYVKKLSLEPPKVLSCKLRLLVSANQDSDEDEDEDILKLTQAESLPVTHAADVSLRLPVRSALIFLVALNRCELASSNAKLLAIVSHLIILGCHTSYILTVKL